MLKHFLCLALFLAAPAHAGGPLAICPVGAKGPINYPSPSTITLNYDQGFLGTRTKAQADALVTEAVALWTDVTTATVTLARGSDLPVDVTTANYTTYYSVYNDSLNPVIYDTDGSIIDLLKGTGAKNSILGFAGSSYSWNSTTCRFTEGRAIINGYKVVDDIAMKTVLAHEIGHLIGLDHTQLDSTQGLSSAYGTSNYPLMYPIAYRDYATLHEDDVAAVSALYPDTTIDSVYGQLTGTFTLADGTTPILGANLWAEETSTQQLFSIVSDYLMQNTGYFKLFLPAGTYTLHAEAVQSSFDGGSSVGPYSDLYPTDPSFQSPLYVGGVAMTPVALGNATPTQISIVAGCAANAGFKLDGSGTVSGNCVASCNYTLDKTSQPVSASAFSGTVTISTTSGCAWTAVSNDSWITVTSVTSGSGNGYVGYSVAANTGTASRTGTVTIAGQIFTITQAGTNLSDAPTLLSVASSQSAATLSFSAPASTGGSTITHYTGTCSATGYATRTATRTGSPVVVNRLNSGVSYSCTVSATNSAGTSAESAAMSVTPTDVASANSVLQMPWFTKVTGYISRFVLLNTGPASASYAISVLTEDGNSIALNSSAASGTISARQQAIINVDDLIQSFSAGQRAMAIITSDAAAGTLIGIYNLVQPSTGAISNVSLLSGTDFSSGSSVLFAPWFSTDTAYSSAFILSNAGNTDATATPTFLAPSGATITPLASTLTIPAQGQLIVSTASLATLSGGTTGAVLFGINAPEGRIKGTYKINNLASGTASSTELINPHTTVAASTRLAAPWFSTSPDYSSNFILTNRGGSAASYTVSVQTETGNTASTGSLSGTIPAHGQLIIPASQIVTGFSSSSRAGAYFDVSGSPADIDGAYQIVSDSTGAISTTLLARADTSGSVATTLKLPWLSGATGYISRFVLVNRGTSAASFTIEILPEAGNAVTQILTSGTIPANGQLVLPVADVISGFSGASRAAAIFTVSAPAADIDGLYNIVNPTSGAISNTLMTK